ncbi:MAG: hypothetical protein AAB410_03915 [Patescibacteria group bacterium]
MTGLGGEGGEQEKPGVVICASRLGALPGGWLHFCQNRRLGGCGEKDFPAEAGMEVGKMIGFFRSLDDLGQAIFVLVLFFSCAGAWWFFRTLGRALKGLADRFTPGGLLSAGFRANGAKKREEDK